jgi:NADH-quinone oxidoreductase subunit C
MFEDILKLVNETSRQLTPVVDENAFPKAIKIHEGDLVNVCRELYQSPRTYFDMLSCITAIDNGPEARTIDIAYNLYSIPYNLHLMLKVTLPRENTVIDSVSSIWRTANWHEREIFDLFGVTFNHHPDLRRILLPADWEGHPLRKDYKQQEYYKNIKLDY